MSLAALLLLAGIVGFSLAQRDRAVHDALQDIADRAAAYIDALSESAGELATSISVGSPMDPAAVAGLELPALAAGGPDLLTPYRAYVVAGGGGGGGGPPHGGAVLRDLRGVLALHRDAAHQGRDLRHLGLPHPDAGELLRPDPDAAGLHGGRVPRQEVLVRDDVRLLEVQGDLRAPALRGHVDRQRVALREAVLLRQHLETPLVEGMREDLRVPHATR